MKAIKDAWYLFGLWVIMRVNKQAAGELMERWGKFLQRFE